MVFRTVCHLLISENYPSFVFGKFYYPTRLASWDFHAVEAGLISLWFSRQLDRDIIKQGGEVGMKSEVPAQRPRQRDNHKQRNVEKACAILLGKSLNPTACQALLSPEEPENAIT